MKKQILNFFKGIGTIALYFILAIIATLIFGNYYNSDNTVLATLSQLGFYIIILLGIGLIYHKRLIEDAKNFKKTYLNSSFRNWILGLAFMLLTNLIIINFVGDISSTESANRETLFSYPLSSAITMIFIAPLIEEITFRLSFKKAFKKWWTYSLVTGLIFGLAHVIDKSLINYLFIIPYGALGFFFGKAFFETDNIYTSYFAHLIHNAVSILLIIFF